MRSTRTTACSITFLALVCVIPSLANGQQPPKPLSEKTLCELVDLQIEESAILSKVKQQGVNFTPDAAVLDRLKKAGASDALLEAIRSTTNSSKTAVQSGPKAITYQDVLKLLELGLDESTIIKRLQASPTHFTLDPAQEAELKKANASAIVIAAMRGDRATAPVKKEPITDFAIVLDCSGSMSEKTSDGQSKMVEAKRVVSELVNRLPESLRVTLIVYGYDRALNCQAVKVARSLAPLDASGKSDLVSQVSALQPVGGTPIGAALELAGRELSKNDSPSGMVLISDGKETCNGDPAGVAASLVGRLKLTFGLHVVGFDVEGDERASLAAIAEAGKGRYFNAQTTADLNKAIDGLRRDLEIQAKPAETAVRIGVKKPRVVKILPPKIELPPMEAVYLSHAGLDQMVLGMQNIGKVSRYGQVIRIAPSDKAEQFDVWWAPVNGKVIRMASGISISEPSIEIQPADYLGLVRVTGANLPKANTVLLTTPGAELGYLAISVVQSNKGYGKDMALAPGFYDLWIEPADGSRTERVVEKVEIVAGKVTVIE